MKDEIRRNLINKRLALANDEIILKSNIIRKRLFNLSEFIGSKTILFYLSFNSEVRTHEMVKKCLNSNKRVIVPISKKEDRSLILSELFSWEDLEIGSYGILEPRNDKIRAISIDDIDLIIVPGVGFDECGRRIGHGKGYYDNLLKKAKGIIKIGLAFEAQIADNIPIEEHDLPVDLIVTEKRVINCKN